MYHKLYLTNAKCHLYLTYIPQCIDVYKLQFYIIFCRLSLVMVKIQIKSAGNVEAALLARDTYSALLIVLFLVPLCKYFRTAALNMTESHIISVTYRGKWKFYLPRTRPSCIYNYFIKRMVYTVTKFTPSSIIPNHHLFHYNPFSDFRLPMFRRIHGYTWRFRLSESPKPW